MALFRPTNIATAPGHQTDTLFPVSLLADIFNLRGIDTGSDLNYNKAALARKAARSSCFNVCNRFRDV